MINIEGLNKAEVLRTLYNHSQPLGMGFLEFTPQDMTLKEAESLLSESTHFDYLSGRVMKVNLESDVEFEEWLYDRDNGAGKAKKLVDSLR